MKYLFIITLISFFTLNASAQTVAMAPTASDTKTTISAQKKALKKRHTLTAMQQINVHLQQNLEYTPEMETCQLEGVYELTVSLKPNGKIAKFEIKEDKSYMVYSAVKDALKTLDQVRYHGNRYEGQAQVRIPIKLLKY